MEGLGFPTTVSGVNSLPDDHLFHVIETLEDEMVDEGLGDDGDLNVYGDTCRSILDAIAT